MIHTRREFLRNSAFIAMASGCFSSRAQGEELSRIPILQGATSYTSTQINALSTENITFKIVVLSGSVGNESLRVEKVQKTYSPWAAYRLFIENLHSENDYQLEVWNEKGNLIDLRSFRTLKPEISEARIALASCMRDNVAAHTSMWSSLEASDPDLLFLLGDNVYVDDGPDGRGGPVTPEKIWRRYVETRCTLGLYKFPKLIPTLATWDDHDFGLNNTYGNRHWSEYSRDTFRTLYAQDSIMPEVTWGPGISTEFSAYGQRFFLMDDRSFREMRWIGYSHWGQAQETWLLTRMNLQFMPTWLFNGSQFFGGYRTGWSFEGNHPKAFKNILNRLKEVKSPVIFGSGDIHYSEVMKIENHSLGYETLEITSSSMHSNAKAPRRGNKRRLLSTGEFNFVIVDVQVLENGLEMQVRSIGEKSRELFNLDSFKVVR